MSIQAWWDVSGDRFDDAGSLTDFMIESLNLVTPHGTRGFTLRLGPVGSAPADMPLRLDLDPDPGSAPLTSVAAVLELPEITLATVEGAAAARWLPQQLVAVDDAFTGCDIHVMEDSGQPLLEVPAAMVRVSVATAIGLAVEYCESGTRPTGDAIAAQVQWEAVGDADV
jgi:hypothetical protein